MELTFFKDSIAETWGLPWNMHKFQFVQTLAVVFSFDRYQYAEFSAISGLGCLPSLNHLVFRVNKCIDDDLATWEHCIISSTVSAWDELYPVPRQVTWQVPFESTFQCEGYLWSFLPRFLGYEEFEKVIDGGLLDFCIERQPDPRSPSRAALEEFVNAPYGDVSLSRVLSALVFEFCVVAVMISVTLLLRSSFS